MAFTLKYCVCCLFKSYMSQRLKCGQEKFFFLLEMETCSQSESEGFLSLFFSLLIHRNSSAAILPRSSGVPASSRPLTASSLRHRQAEQREPADDTGLRNAPFRRDGKVQTFTGNSALFDHQNHLKRTEHPGLSCYRGTKTSTGGSSLKRTQTPPWFRSSAPRTAPAPRPSTAARWKPTRNL